MLTTQLPSFDDRKKTSWPEIIALLSALGTSIYASSIQQSWFVIVPILLAVITTILLLRDIGLFRWLASFYRLTRGKFKGNLAVRQNYVEYLRFVERVEIVKELIRELRNAKWHHEKTIFHVQHISTISFEYLYTEILNSTKEQRIKRIKEMELIGQRFRDFINTFNHFFLQLYSLGFKEGEVQYQNEDHRKRIIKLKNSYDKIIEEYNNFCKTLNYKAHREILWPIHDAPPDLDWPAGTMQSN